MGTASISNRSTVDGVLAIAASTLFLLAKNAVDGGLVRREP